MKTLRTALIIVCVYLTFTCSLGGQENGDVLPPARFRNLMAVGKTVMLRPSPNHPMYTIQLLSDEQAALVQEDKKKYTESLRRYSEIEKLLDAEQPLEQLATLLKEQHNLQRWLTRSDMVRRTAGSFFEVMHVGEDYVGFRANGSERFVPVSAIRFIYRSEKLEPDRRVSFRSRSLSAGRSVKNGAIRIELRNTDANDVASVIEQLYSDVKLEISVDPDSGLLTIKSEEASELRRVEELIRALDTARRPAARREE